ncbi:hypothetical protein LCGC14_2184560, partial [marine sediment metagenome]
MAKQVFFFGHGSAEGDPDDKDVLGGKGASLAAMSRAGLPVPAGFTISTECCRGFLAAGSQWPDGLREQVDEQLVVLEAATGRRFGDASNPLLVSVRSGAAVSMPGMMDTILNCGLFPQMADSQADPAAFWEVYGQFVVMFAKTVADMKTADFDAAAEQFRGAREDPAAPLTAGLWGFEHDFLDAIYEIISACSDIVTFHSYDGPDVLEDQIRTITQTANGRPVICTEYMARTRGCTFRDCLPILRRGNIGAINWGLVAGKTQTIYPWDWDESKGQPEVFFHDIFNPDGTLLYPDERAVFAGVTVKQ